MRNIKARSLVSQQSAQPIRIGLVASSTARLLHAIESIGINAVLASRHQRYIYKKS